MFEYEKKVKFEMMAPHWGLSSDNIPVPNNVLVQPPVIGTGGTRAGFLMRSGIIG